LVRSPLEAHTSYRGRDWSPQRLMFHQNLESFADRVGLIVGLQSNGKMSQEEAYTEIRKIWKDLKTSKDVLLTDLDTSAD
jgi:phage-related tail protein